MPKAKVTKDPIAKAHLAYSGFPMRQVLQTTCAVGELMPVYMDILSPGDKVHFSHNLNLRLNYLERPANENLTAHVDWFFVPLEQLFKPFGQMFYGISDFGSDLFAQGNAPSVFPSVTLKEVLDVIKKYASKSVSGPAVSTEYLTNSVEVGAQTSTYGQYVVGMFRLMDSLGLPMIQLSDYWSSAWDSGKSPAYAANLSRKMSLWFPLAYQKIWYDHYRLADRVANDPKAYNVDSFYNYSQTAFSAQTLEKIFQPHLVPWARDYFTHNFVSPIVPSNSAAKGDSSPYGKSLLSQINLAKVNNWLGTNSIYAASYDNETGDYVSNVSAGYAPTTVVSWPSEGLGYDEQPQFSVANIRAAFAVEKLLEVTRRAGKHYDKQTLAHFGVKVPQGVSGESYKLASFSQPIVIGDIVATAAGESGDNQSVLGELGGRGYSDTDALNCKSKGSFEAKCHGVLMAVQYITPEVHYAQVGMNRLNKLIERTDFYIPEFENLGMQPMFGYEGFFYMENTSGSAYTLDTILGWKYRYAEFKEKYNVTRGGYLGTLSDWSASRVWKGGGAASYYVNPSYLNPILSVFYSSGQSVANYAYLLGVTPYPTSAVGSINTPASLFYAQVYSQDPFVMDMLFQVNKVSKMSVYGLPNL